MFDINRITGDAGRASNQVLCGRDGIGNPERSASSMGGAIERPIRSTLTSRDYAALELRLLEALTEGEYFHLFPAYASAKLADADVQPVAAIADDVATANSRVIFSAGALGQQSRILILRPEQTTVGLTISVMTLLGLALLGMRGGQTGQFFRHDGSVASLTLHSVAFQPEAASRSKIGS
ncbi:hypothetical protein ABIE65_005575 [Constrictibacter sp. MBR-5]|jgi:hypothetical protein|uniref:hypothetical protein n=1 Tax=Constrictibacter sp. MBR-5 TaxID=3156467 RepID=UPI0033992896